MRGSISERSFSEVINYLRKVKGVRAFETHVEFTWRKKKLFVSSILEKLNEYARTKVPLFLVIIDEAQESRFLRGYRN